MEYVIMFISHLFKTAEYFVVEGFPQISIDQLPEAVEALFWQSAKIIEIYFSMIA